MITSHILPREQAIISIKFVINIKKNRQTEVKIVYYITDALNLFFRQGEYYFNFDVLSQLSSDSHQLLRQFGKETRMTIFFSVMNYYFRRATISHLVKMGKPLIRVQRNLCWQRNRSIQERKYLNTFTGILTSDQQKDKATKWPKFSSRLHQKMD